MEKNPNQLSLPATSDGADFDEELVLPHDIGARISDRIAKIDELLSQQVSEILHHPEFRGSKRPGVGLEYLTQRTPTSSQLKLQVLPVSKAELREDLLRAKFRHTTLFQKIHEEEYGMPGGEPFMTLLGDFYFGDHPQDIALLKKISQVAAAAHAHSSPPQPHNYLMWIASLSCTLSYKTQGEPGTAL